MSLQPKENSHDFLAINIVPGPFMLLAAVCIVLRFVHHRRKGIVWWDDWAILAAFVTGAGAYISGLLCALAGYRIDEYTISQLNTCAKVGLTPISMSSSPINKRKLIVCNRRASRAKFSIRSALRSPRSRFCCFINAYLMSIRNSCCLHAS